MTPVELAPNVIAHFYRGGARIAALRGIELASDHCPEEWLAATVTRDGSAGLGLARTVDDRLLADLVGADPHAWVGSSARRAADADTGVLVKLLDAGQRLPVHVHPDRDFARSHLACPYGKTEAWYVLDADPGAAVHLGWRDDVDAADLARARDEQDSAWMLSRMHRLEVAPGDGILVPAGQVHAIGEGVFVVEAQEPTDLSIVLEWSVTTSTGEESHLGLGFDTAMAAVSRTALADVGSLVRRDAAQACLPGAADPYFRIDRLVAGPSIAAGYAVAVVLSGSGTASSDAGCVEVGAGSVWAVPAGFGDWSVTGDAQLVVVRPGVGWPESLGDRS